MEHRRGFGLRSSVLALLLAASAMGAGCSGNDTPAIADTGVADVGTADGSTVGDTGTIVDTGVLTDTGATTDTGAMDSGGMDDAGDAGTPIDTGSVDGGGPTDAGVDGGTDGGVRPDGGTTSRPHAGASLVSAGSLMRSARFQMISTLGGRSVQQTNLQSPNYRLRGGLVGTIGAR